MTTSNMTVVKLGGSLLENPATRREALDAIAATWRATRSLVMVHGGGKRIDHLSGRLGLPKRTLEGLRITDPAMLEVVVSILAGVVNKTLVAELHSIGIDTAGLTGADGATFRAEVHPAVHGVDLGLVGRITSVHPELVLSLSDAGFLPVVGSIALGTGGVLLNVNADSAASALAVAIRAPRLVFLTDVEGVIDRRGQILEILDIAAAESLLDSHAVSGGMKPKLLAAIAAIQGGVTEVGIAGPRRHREALEGGKGGTHLVAA